MSIIDEIEENLPELDLLTFLFLGDDQKVLNKYNSILKEYSCLKKLPAKFNEIFANKGWIATDDFPVPVMDQAIKIFEEDGIEKAEIYLADQLTDSYFFNNIRRMKAIWIFGERRGLIELAYNDHKEKRYHASVPVILSQIDGLIYDIAGQSFYKQGKRLDIFKIKSQVTGIINKLDVVAKKMNKSRNETKNVPLTFPYRNLILHGRDINYNNILVSSKCFFNLFAIRPWALFIQQNELNRREGNDFIEIPRLKIGKKLSDYIDRMIKQ